MEFLTLLITLGLLQYWGSGGPLQRDDWFIQLGKKLQDVIPIARLRLAVWVGLPLFLVLLLQIVLDSLLYGLLSLLFFIAVLLFCLGRGDYSKQLHNYLQSWDQGNFESAYQNALDIGDFKQSDAIADQTSLHNHVRRAFIYEGFERWFAVIFWFLLLGPLGAAGYRLSYLAARQPFLDQTDQQLTLRFVHCLDVIPARLLAFSFSLAGDFSNTFAVCKQRFWDNAPVSELLEDCALAAINQRESQPASLEGSQFIEFAHQQLLSLQSLLSRSVICWLAVVALVTLLS